MVDEEVTCEEFVVEWLHDNYDKENRVPYIQLARGAHKDCDERWTIHYLRVVIAKLLKEQREPDRAVMEAMKKDYSRIGGMPGLTQKDIALKYGITVQKFQEIKEKYGWTHKSAPVTEAELEEKDMKDLIDNLLYKEEQLFTENYLKKRQKKLEKYARNWLDLKEGQIRPFLEVMREVHPGVDLPEPDYTDGVVELGGEVAPFIQMCDVHLGKQAVDGGGTRLVLDYLWQSLHFHAKRLAPYNPKTIQLVAGNDWFHVDSEAKTTTRGTPQDVDLPVYDLVGEGYATLMQVIEFLKREFPDSRVEVSVVRSNHDSMSTIHLGYALQYVYTNDSRVTIRHSRSLRQYISYGKNAIGLSHGHGVRLKEIPTTMAFECPNFSDAWFHYFITGHLHHTKDQYVSEVDDGGVHVLQGTSVSLTDRWHHENGYNKAQKGMASYVFHKTQGNVARYLALPFQGMR